MPRVVPSQVVQMIDELYFSEDTPKTPFTIMMRTAAREYLEIAFRQRRQHILGECRQLKIDVDSYNQNINTGPPIQMVFDFTLDLEEMEAAA